jgi:hypothetical protein
MSADEAFERAAVNDAMDSLAPSQMNLSGTLPGCHQEEPAGRGDTSVAFMMGNGYTFSPNAGQSGGQQWHDMILRLSHALNASGLRVDAGLNNYGHDPNAHPDGWFLQLTLSKEILRRLTLDLSIGGMYSMNTTIPAGGSEVDQKGIDLMASATLRYYLGLWGLDARVECDGVKDTNIIGGKGPDSIMCVAGLGKTFGSLQRELAYSSTDNNDKSKPWSVDAGALYFRTNHQGTSHTIGSNVYLSRDFGGGWVGRLGYMTTGDDGSVNDDRGFDFMIHKYFALGDGHTKLYTGLGASWEFDDLSTGKNKSQLDLEFTFLGAEYDWKRFYSRLEYDRLARTTNAPLAAHDGGDADMVRFNGGFKFGNLWDSH